MRNGKTIATLVILTMLLLPFVCLADETDDLRKKIMFDQKKLLVMENVEFTTDEGEAFWPLFDKLQEELFVVNQRSAKLILAYASVYETLTDDQAAKIVNEYFAIRRERTAIFDKYVQQMLKNLPTKKVFRYVQVENKLEVMARYEIAKEVPLAR